MCRWHPRDDLARVKNTFSLLAKVIGHARIAGGEVCQIDPWGKKDGNQKIRVSPQPQPTPPRTSLQHGSSGTPPPCCWLRPGSAKQAPGALPGGKVDQTASGVCNGSPAKNCIRKKARRCRTGRGATSRGEAGSGKQAGAKGSGRGQRANRWSQAPLRLNTRS